MKRLEKSPKALTILRATSGFTLIELLVVIGIIAILAVLITLAINPAEMQRKGRDAARLADMTGLRKAIDLSITDGKVLQGTLTTSYSHDSTQTRTASSLTNYVGMDVSKYVSILPVDPRQTATAVTVISDGLTQVAAGAMRYDFSSNGQYYEINTYLESVDNNDKALNDGGNSATKYEIGTFPGLSLL